MTLDTLRDFHGETLKDFRPLAGVYFLFKDGKLVYIGQSAFIQRRLTTHDHHHYDEAAYIEVPNLRVRIKLERDWIQSYKPTLNLYHIDCNGKRKRQHAP